MDEREFFSDLLPEGLDFEDLIPHGFVSARDTSQRVLDVRAKNRFVFRRRTSVAIELKTPAANKEPGHGRNETDGIGTRSFSKPNQR